MAVISIERGADAGGEAEAPNEMARLEQIHNGQGIFVTCVIVPDVTVETTPAGHVEHQRSIQYSGRVAAVIA